MDQNLEIKSSAITDKGLSDKRPQNEDSYLELPESGMYAVADGVGGAFGGDVASQMAVETLSEAFVNLNKGGDVEERMQAAIRQANAAIFQMSQELPQLSTMATTLVAVQITGNIATIGHVGDSRLYRLDPEGVLFQETQDHSLVEEQVRAGRMTRAQAAVHPSRNVISRALGAEEGVEIDLKTIMFDPGSKFLVCSDGITKHIEDDELRDLLSTIDDPTTLCKEFKKRCYERGAEDNLTAVVVVTKGAADSGDLLELDDDVETVATARAVGSAPVVPESTPVAKVGNETEPATDLDADTLDLEEKAPEEVIETARAGFAETENVVDNEAPTPDFLEETIASKRKQESEGLATGSLDAVSEDSEVDDEPDIEIPLKNKESVEAEVVQADTEIESSSLSAENEVKSYRVEDSSSGGFFAKAVSALLWTLVGLLIGLIAFYVYSNLFGSRSPGVQNANLAIYEFEQKRRLVDADPARYITAYGVSGVVTASDHYLVGRAHLLQKNYGAAKTSFENARKALASEGAINRKVLDFDIATGMFIATNEAAQTALSGEGVADDVPPPASPGASPEVKGDEPAEVGTDKPTPNDPAGGEKEPDPKG